MTERVRERLQLCSLLYVYEWERERGWEGEQLTFLRLVFTINSRARCWIGAGSSGRRTILLSRGSPGTIAQWSNTERQNACPWVWYLKSVSKPNDSMTGKNAWKSNRAKIRNIKFQAYMCIQIEINNAPHKPTVPKNFHWSYKYFLEDLYVDKV